MRLLEFFNKHEGSNFCSSFVLENNSPRISSELAAQILSDPRCKHGVKVSPKASFWRGQSENSGHGMATYGTGFYFTVNPKDAQKYGEVERVSPTMLPDNPLRFDTTNDFQIWLQRAYTSLGYKSNLEFTAAYHDLRYFIKALDPRIDGIQMFTGKDVQFVTYSEDDQHITESDESISAEVQQFATEIKSRFGLQDFDLSWAKVDRSIKLYKIIVPKEIRNTGAGSKAVQALCTFADAHGLRIDLSPAQKADNWGTTSQARLITFYKRFGFVQNRGRNGNYAIRDLMYREPRGKMNESITNIPAELASLAKEIHGLSFEAAKRRIVAKTGSVKPGERFADDVADAVFQRIQRNAQAGSYTENDLRGRNPKRLTGDEPITLYRAAPKGAGIRPGDFAAGTAHEAGFYTHGGHKIISMSVPRKDVIAVDGSSGGGQEFVYLPQGYMAPTPKEYFRSFREFYAKVQS